jgi:class 3 adenylate cyclase
MDSRVLPISTARNKEIEAPKVSEEIIESKVPSQRSIDRSLRSSAGSGRGSRTKCKKLILKIIEHWGFTAFMTSLTVYALFGDDIRLIATSKDADDIFYGLSVVCLFFFSLEIILASLVKPGYWLSFYFWLDFVATISLIPDIGWIWDPIMGDSGGGNNAVQATKIARAGRASRAGTRAGRIVRVLRVIRLIRIAKLYKLSQEAKLRAEESENQRTLKRGCVTFRGNSEPIQHNILAPPGPVVITEPDEASISHSFDTSPVEEVGAQDISDTEDEENVEANMDQESKVGKKLSDLTTRRTILLVLGMMFGLPLFVTHTYLDPNNSYQFGLEVLNSFVYDPQEFESAWDYYISKHDDLYTPLIYLEFEEIKTWESDTDPEDLRTLEKELITIQNPDPDYEYKSVAIFDLRKETRLQAGLNIIRTIFVCVILAVFSLQFSGDANRLVLGPIENMMAKVKKIAVNPLHAAQEEEQQAITYELMLQENPDLAKMMDEGGSSTDRNLETKMLEQTISKIGALLALGFGEAGSEIIATNMQKGGGEVDPMIPGKKAYCIFGFCDIRNFTDATEVLQEEVMQFVNEIASIVHSTVDAFSGAANKNIGDAFLLVWKFPDETVEIDPVSKEMKPKKHPFVPQLADMALISFLKIQAEINRNYKILKYRENQALTKRMPNYSVKMGFGLHVGWGIEGAIGSSYKIDASYLSPNVNMAARLEAATKQFGVPMLVSGSLRNLCSSDAKACLRHIDRVTVKGSKEPMDLYTVDVDIKNLIPSPPDSEQFDRKRRKVLGKIKRDKLRKQAYHGVIQVSSLISTDEDLINMRKTVSVSFITAFSKAFKLYIAGKWPESKAGLEECLRLRGESDGPTNTLLEVIESNDGVAPSDWRGYRELTEK